MCSILEKELMLISYPYCFVIPARYQSTGMKKNKTREKKVNIRHVVPLNSHGWPRKNFFLQYQYNINQISDQNREKYLLGDY